MKDKVTFFDKQGEIAYR